MRWTEALTGPHSWVFQVFAVVLSVLLANFIFFRLLGRLRRRVEKTETPWDDALVNALWKPLRVFVWIIGLGFAVEVIQRETEAAAIFEAAKPARDVGVVVVIAWFLIRLVEKSEENLIHAGEAKIENPQVFQGMPISIPTIDIHTIGSGGGSIAWIDSGGLDAVNVNLSGGMLNGNPLMLVQRRSVERDGIDRSDSDPSTEEKRR